MKTSTIPEHKRHRMPKWRALAVALSTGALLLSACGGSSENEGEAEQENEGEAEQITLRLATGLGEQHAYWSHGAGAWATRVEELTDGAVTFETYTGGELVETPAELEALQAGTIDVALMLPIHSPDQFPLAEVTMLPITHSNPSIAAEAWRALFESDEQLSNGKTYYDSEYGDKDLKAWPLAPTQEYSISTTGQRITDPDSFTSLSLRTPSRIHEMYASKVGVNSISIPAVEMYDAMSRGAFDGSFYSVADWTGHGLQDLFKYTLTGVNFGHFNTVLAMTSDTWDGLPPDVQAAMDQAHDEIYMGTAEEWVRRGEEMVQYNTENGGVFESFEDLPQETQDLILSGMDGVWSEYIDLLETQGQPGHDAVLLWRDLLVESGGEVSEPVSALN